MHRLTNHKSLIAVLLVAGLTFGMGRVARGEDEAKLIDVLKSQADQKAKADACMALARVGTKAAVPALAALLSDEKLAHMARYGMERIPDPSVDEVLRDALGKLKGRLLVGVIGSLGVRHDAKAVPALAALLGDADADTAQAAARALGSIGTPEAVKAITEARPKTASGNQVAFCEGLLRAAEGLMAADKAAEAQAIYDGLRTIKDAAHQIRTAALHGAVLARKDAGLPMLMEALKGEDYVLVEAAARTAMELPGEAVTKALSDELAKLPVDKQVLVTFALGTRADPAAAPALAALAKSGEKDARIAALRALPEVGGGAAVPVLLGLFSDPDVGGSAREALTAMPGKEVDSAVLAMLDDQDAKTREMAIDLLGQRRVEGAPTKLLKAAADADEKVRLAAVKALGKMAGQAEFSAIVDLLLKAKSPEEVSAFENTLGAICTREARLAPEDVVISKAVYGDLPDGKVADVSKKVMELIKTGKFIIEASNENFGDPTPGVQKRFMLEYSVGGVSDSKTVGENQSITLNGGITPPACVDPLCAALPKAPKDAKLALLRVVRTARGPKALEAVRAAAKDADVKATAITALCDWTVEALPDIRELLKSEDKRTKILALRGCLRLIPQQKLTADKKLAELKEVITLIERPEEKRLSLAALGAIPSSDALSAVMGYLQDGSVKEEACMAAVAISETLVKSDKAKVAEAMDQVLKSSGNKRTTSRASELQKQAK